VSVQQNVTGTTIQNNIMVSNPVTKQFILITGTGSNFAPNAIDWNLYSGATIADMEFIWNGAGEATFLLWRTASNQDGHSSFTATATTQIFTNAALDVYNLFEGSPATNAGDPTFSAAVGEQDYLGGSRVAGGRVDVGADEYLTPFQAWRELYFGLPDGGPDANAADDPDHDGLENFLEYALGSNPTVPSASAAPNVSLNAQGRLVYSFTRYLQATDLTLTIQASADLTNWTDIASKAGTASWSTSSSDIFINDSETGAVTLTDSAFVTGGRRFVRLTVSQ
jgi:hypothetical protein